MKKGISVSVALAAALFLLLSVTAGISYSASQDGTYVCDCGKDCKCGTIANQPGKCVCGNEMKKTGNYECNCGKDCKCGTIANQPGKCVCGVDMKKMQK